MVVSAARRYLVSTALLAFVAIPASCAGRRSPPPANASTGARATPPPAVPPVAGTYTGRDRNTITVTSPMVMPAQVVESSARLEIDEVTASSLRVTLVDEEEGARCPLSATGGPSRWTLTAGQRCQHTRGQNVITLTVTGGALVVEGDAATIDFEASAEVAPATPNAAAPRVTGNASYHLAAQRGAGAASDAGAGAAVDASAAGDAGATGDAAASDAGTRRARRARGDGGR